MHFPTAFFVVFGSLSRSARFGLMEGNWRVWGFIACSLLYVRVRVRLFLVFSSCCFAFVAFVCLPLVRLGWAPVWSFFWWLVVVGVVESRCWLGSVRLARYESSCVCVFCGIGVVCVGFGVVPGCERYCLWLQSGLLLASTGHDISVFIMAKMCKWAHES
ncbi:uncharacterized protein K452DRAFT_132776 [Aplosporella prunicola CBS 121167]|uniref:Transmembrane protein n=1 Tax=Aplosporella prunicola CBS 121167 TaxID=1176127 RepID=A0A6A6BQT9_9PEZI|nr:uncharacterized protein K452DRAFT_132776 [Aplosporella prunicola CBS 121167]KAF2144951.1 hypothetical protein K452DRAFT_132776 [Aplosporella prunicola CBS 121167]